MLTDMRPMPAGLEALPDLALNLRWTWTHAADRLWQELSPEAWTSTRNPWLVLQIVLQARLEQCASNPAFRELVAHVTSLRNEYLTQPTWCSQSGVERPPLTAYFCLEFGLAEALPIYAGGLGILAGDHLKTASDLGVPMVGVGLLYSEGYFRQVLDADGFQQELYPPNAAYLLPIAPARDASGVQLCVTLALPGRSLTVRVWQVQVGHVPLLLLDCNDPRNSAPDRGITATLYAPNLETRLMQQMVLGIAGWRALAALGYAPQVCHINEGPAALAALERIAALMEEQALGFEQALWAARPGNVFTSHTPVAAAFDTFPPEQMLRYLRGHLARCGIDEDRFLALGRRDPADADEPFNPAYFGLRCSGRINGVSELHGTVSRQLYQDLYPRWPVHEVPIGHVTNGVHVPTWDSAGADEVWTRACGKRRWHGALEGLTPAIEALDDRTLWDLKIRERQGLVGYVRRRLARQIQQRGRDGELHKVASRVLDPNVLTIGFARRFTSYKRPNLLLRDPDRLARLLGNSHYPVQIIVAGKAHPRDEAGKTMIREWGQFCQRPDVRARAVFLEDYDIDLASEMVEGIDVWINTPRRPWEACGTSGMKVLVNGGLNLSEPDGWWAEACTPEVGWKLQGITDGDEARTDALEAESLYRLLEQEVVPLFYQRNGEGIPQRWVAMMRASMAQLAPRFSSNRMLREYFQSAYCPGAAAHERRAANNAALAVELQAWAAALRAGWHQIHIGSVQRQREGARLRCSAQVYLGEIGSGGVAVQLYADGLQGGGAEVHVLQRRAPIAGALNAFVYDLELDTPRADGDYTLRVVPYHPQAVVPLELELIHWHDAGA
ncbi:MAG: alpha-glucan family phosphorylase [Nevskia sp.]|nr:alpha-glucan family phosphorylase [Nevskia sp.]